MLKCFIVYLEELPKRSSLPSALVRRLGHQPPRPSPSRSRDTASDVSDPESESSYSDSDDSESSNQDGRSRKKRMRMRMYADEEEEKGKRRKLQARLRNGSPKKESAVTALKSRPVHTRLGPVISPQSNDLRRRLGSSTGKNADGPTTEYDQENSDSSDGFIAEKNTVDLRSKLKGRPSVK